jgi:hypothetical protein
VHLGNAIDSTQPMIAATLGQGDFACPMLDSAGRLYKCSWDLTKRMALLAPAKRVSSE